MPPDQRREAAYVGRRHARHPGGVGQHLLQHERVHIHQARLQQVQGVDGHLLVVQPVAGHLAALAEEKVNGPDEGEDGGTGGGGDCGGTAGEDGTDGRRPRVFARGYSVFNAAQVDGYEVPALPALPEPERIGHAEAFFAALGADIRHGGNRACYVPGLDQIRMPPFPAFRDAVAYYATLAHEATHLTGHPGAEGPFKRKHTVRNENTGRIGVPRDSLQPCTLRGDAMLGDGKQLFPVIIG